MYKDKDKQRKSDRERQRKHRAAKKVTNGVTSESVTHGGVTQYLRVTDQEFTRLMAADAGGPIVRVSKPGDPDYVPMCETTKAFVEDRPKSPVSNKRGQDIQCFDDLPPDVQQTIRTISQSNEEFKKRTDVAIRYQHTFPERY